MEAALAEPGPPIATVPSEQTMRGDGGAASRVPHAVAPAPAPAIAPVAAASEVSRRPGPRARVHDDAWLAPRGGVHPLTPGYRLAKRALDLTLAIGLGLGMLPLVPLLALAIRLDSPGPVLYRQTRVGRGGRPFQIYKFRTMRQNAEGNGPVWAQLHDDRVTRVGRGLRLTRIDELPQLWNILRGEMSFVGPRPERPEFVELLSQQLSGYRLRHVVTPGITGWAQVRYRYASSIEDSRIKLEYDLYYVTHASWWLDCQILLRTLLVIVRMQGR
jgi:exopolysaccharide biosynthesis polyprenyl glycosylphosphotransferase